jgi:hypothetical protein
VSETAEHATWADFERVSLRAGTIRKVESFDRARLYAQGDSDRAQQTQHLRPNAQARGERHLPAALKYRGDVIACCVAASLRGR